MRGAVLYGPIDIRFVEREDPEIVEPTDAIIRISATCVCGSDLWPYRGIDAPSGPTPMGHEYCGIVEEVGSAVENVRPGQFVVGSFFAEVHLLGGPAPVRRYLPELIDLVWRREIDPGKVFDLRLPLEQVAEGYRAMDERRAIKALLIP
jgi:threonine dehydrogenase-like Zn-dependent dehydrogenase